LPIGQNSLPARVIVAPHDTLHFINADDKRVHRISARDLPGFDSRKKKKKKKKSSFFRFFHHLTTNRQFQF
jgi:plastocyanin